MQNFLEIPRILATVRRTTSSGSLQPLNLWLEEIRADSFSACLREVITFSGEHKDVQVVRASNVSFLLPNNSLIPVQKVRRIGSIPFTVFL